MMKTLLLPLAVCAACGSSSGTLHVTWDATTCGADDTLFADSVMDGSEVKTTFPCASGTGDVPLDTGTWMVTLSLVDGSEADVDGSETFTATIHDNQIAVLSGFVLPTGRFSLTWTVTVGAAPVDCATANAASVELTSTRLDCSDSPCVTVDTFDCSAMTGMSSPLDEGDYDVELDLVDANRQTLTSIGTTATYHLAARGESDLGSFAFSL